MRLGNLGSRGINVCSARHVLACAPIMHPRYTGSKLCFMASVCRQNDRWEGVNLLGRHRTLATAAAAKGSSSTAAENSLQTIPGLGARYAKGLKAIGIFTADDFLAWHQQALGENKDLQEELKVSIFAFKLFQLQPTQRSFPTICHFAGYGHYKRCTSTVNSPVS